VSPNPSVSTVLVDLVVVVVAARGAAALAGRLGFPVVVAEIAAGVVVGPSVLDLVGESSALGLLAGLGIVLLLFDVGIEFDLAHLGAVARPAVAVALAGTVLTLAGGWGAAMAVGQPSDVALFLAGGVTATSIGISARVFADLARLSTVEARVVLGAAVVDDVLGLVTLAAVTKLVAGEASTAPALGSVTIIGAFAGGLAVAARRERGERVKRGLAPIGRVLVPVFFVRVGVDADLAAIVRPGALGLAAVLLAAAVTAKLVCGAFAFGSTADRVLVGFGMLPRGEVGLVFATLGLHEGILDDERYGALLLTIFVTDLLAPVLLRWRLRRR
jgi:Kef-type K+ transport system membrane component KefB